MNNEREPIRDDQFEAFLDDALSKAERQTISERLNRDEQRLAEADLQAEIDKALRKKFPVAVAPQGLPLPTESTPFIAKNRIRIQRRRLLGGGLAAAALIGVLLTWWALQAGKPAPFFKPTPLAQIYRETLRNGFRPYYECRDDQRFADIFAARQGLAMHLLPMPKGTRMLGLSYPGGLSRDTTAMLCTVNDSPVMVFVDRLKVDNPTAAKVASDQPDVRVFRLQRDGLVFYEVSELDAARAIKYLAVGEPASSRE